MLKAYAGNDPVGVRFGDMRWAVQWESMRDSFFESGGLFLNIPFAEVVHGLLFGVQVPSRNGCDLWAVWA